MLLYFVFYGIWRRLKLGRHGPSWMCVAVSISCCLSGSGFTSGAGCRAFQSVKKKILWSICLLPNYTHRQITGHRKMLLSFLHVWCLVHNVDCKVRMLFIFTLTILWHFNSIKICKNFKKYVQMTHHIVLRTFLVPQLTVVLCSITDMNFFVFSSAASAKPSPPRRRQWRRNMHDVSFFQFLLLWEPQHHQEHNFIERPNK